MAATIRISYGELIDKITILEIRASRTADPARRADAVAYLEELVAERQRHLAAVPGLRALSAELSEVNRTLWDAEDRLRDQERRQEFGEAFVELARNVYRQNDRRSAIKRRIDRLAGSAIVEDKIHPSYGRLPE